MGAAATLGVRLLAHEPLRLALMAASIAVGVVVMLLEIGLLEGVLDAQALVAGAVRGDLLVMSAARADLHHWDTLPRTRLAEVAAVQGVATVIPVYEDHAGLEDPDDNRVRRIIVFAFPPDAAPLAIGDPGRISAALRNEDGFVYDARSRPIFGKLRPGMSVDVDGWPMTVSGLAAMGPDIVNDGAIFVGEGAWLRRHPAARPIMGVVRLSPGARVADVRRAILAATPGDVAALTPAEARRRENAATLRAAPIGLIFGFGVLAGMAIGWVNGYQALYTEVSDRLAQYAAMKAMGFSERFLRGAVLTQALAIAGLGFAIGLPLAALLDAYVGTLTRLPIAAHAGAGALVGVATLASCALAGLMAMRRLDAADPASLF